MTLTSILCTKKQIKNYNTAASLNYLIDFKTFDIEQNWKNARRRIPEPTLTTVLERQTGDSEMLARENWNLKIKSKNASGDDDHFVWRGYY